MLTPAMFVFAETAGNIAKQYTSANVLSAPITCLNTSACNYLIFIFVVYLCLLSSVVPYYVALRVLQNGQQKADSSHTILLHGCWFGKQGTNSNVTVDAASPDMDSSSC